ncbi:A/G-specific adenine glycosylase [Mucilaginibacter gotjawali]|uniref:A/G-specific adenine glycosylase n=2 Tax=Mucilaginibacter gotjawali TaxID=1550579 RepID=A0A839SN74_9SPHI|nr:A/G-specific adenine glycosylase [Mucilaginibacter gotjawali]MBB3059062.1 A/G-specific adenine glycosylase [Mucilaginibacter gotjawali]BAU52134.1 putative A/G-specific adenine glycosylase YfhQ [Mucilaginibacter gotjawali]
MSFSDDLVQWYQSNKRQLPWRDTHDAYVIWLSEIILQQTRVEQGLPYFYSFLEKYPDVSSFAAASEDDILKLWQGLGYYSRGRNMLKTARMVQADYGGIFPEAYDQLIKLKGIGEYTASAISSFAANEPKAVVDGNVYRVLARYFGINEPINSPKGIKIFQSAANELLDKHRPGIHNQAMMEFGAMLCRPKNPACNICPVSEGCYAFANNAVNLLPVKLNKIKIRERYFNYFLVADEHTLVMNRRGDKDIWANMYDLPLIETDTLLPPDGLLALPQLKALFGDDIKIDEIFPVIKHVLTHQRLFVRFIKLQHHHIELKEQWFITDRNNLKKLALPKVIFIFLKNIFNL